MVTMNKPAANSTSWYSDLTTNWSTIQSSLLDNSIVTAKGDLVGASGASTPVRVPVGIQGSILSADSTQTAGLSWKNVGYNDITYLSDLVLQTRFFTGASLLPGTQYYQTPVDSPPTPDWDNTGVVSTTTGTYRRWQGVVSTQLIGWDLGGLKQRILMVVSGHVTCGQTRYLFVSDSKPSTGAPSGNAYAGGDVPSGSGFIYKVTNGSFTNLSATSYVEYLNHPHGVAMLFDNGNVRLFYRFGNFEWMEGTFKNDGTWTKLRYCGIWLASGSDYYLGPVSIYYDT